LIASSSSSLLLFSSCVLLDATVQLQCDMLQCTRWLSGVDVDVAERLKFHPVPVDAKLELGSESQLTCHAEGRVTPVVSWASVGGPRGRGGRGGAGSTGTRGRLPAGVVDLGDGVLLFDRVERSHAGLYTCVAANHQGTIHATIHVDVIGMCTSHRDWLVTIVCWTHLSQL